MTKTPMGEPQTKAGKRMVRWLEYHEHTNDPLPPNHETGIAAIEAEARDAALAEAEAAVENYIIWGEDNAQYEIAVSIIRDLRQTVVTP